MKDIEEVQKAITSAKGVTIRQDMHGCSRFINPQFPARHPSSMVSLFVNAKQFDWMQARKAANFVPEQAA